MISISENYNSTIVADSKTLSRSCLLVLGFFGFGLTIMGGILTGVAYNDPFEDDDFFKKFPKPLKVIGPVLLSIGLFLVLIGVITCINASLKGHTLFPSVTANTNLRVHQPYMGSNVPYPENIQGHQFPNMPSHPSNTPYPNNVPPPGFQPDINQLCKSNFQPDINQSCQTRQQAATCDDLPPPYSIS